MHVARRVVQEQRHMERKNVQHLQQNDEAASQRKPMLQLYCLQLQLRKSCACPECQEVSSVCQQ
jgi:hypothetical protein